MAFRENLKAELEFRDVKVKELAFATGISRRTLDQYLATNAKMPSAETAVKIAAALDVSVEYLVTGKERGSRTDKERDASPDAEEVRAQAHKLRKYGTLFESLDRLTAAQRKLLAQLADELAQGNK